MKTVIIMATGGTIAGVGEKGKSIGYKPGVVSAEELVEKSLGPVVERKDNKLYVPDSDVYIEAMQISNVNSDDITSEIWIDMVNQINVLSKREDVAGFVILSGTDTLEETAYFLDLTVKTDKPVIVSGSMRPSTAIAPDGPGNIRDSIAVAAGEESKGRGVLVVFSERIISAAAVKKESTFSLDAMQGGDMGNLGDIIDGKIRYFGSADKKKPEEAEFDVIRLKTLPKVSIIYFNVDADPALLKAAEELSDGIVIAGAGAGEYSLKFLDTIEKLTKPVVVSTRVSEGIIYDSALLSKNTIAAGKLSPCKAAILLRLALTKTGDRDEIIKIFENWKTMGKHH